MSKFLRFTSINIPELIKLQSNQITGRISKQEIKSNYKNPTVTSQRNKVRKMGRIGRK